MPFGEDDAPRRRPTGCDGRPVAYAVIATGADAAPANFENSLRQSVASIDLAVGDDIERAAARCATRRRRISRGRTSGGAFVCALVLE